MARKTWVGTAATVRRRVTLTLGNPSIGSTYSVTRNGKTVTSVATTTDSTAEASALVTALSGSPEGEFQEVEWSATANSVNVTGPADGRPIELTAAAGGAGTPTLTPTNSTGTGTAATGPHHWSNTANWVPAGVPADADILLLNGASVEIRYEIDQSARTFTAVYGNVNLGLPERNTTANGAEFDEYLPTYAKFAVTGAVIIGTSDGRGPTRFKLDLLNAANPTAVTVVGSGTSPGQNTPAVLIKGLHSSGTLNVTAGSAGLAALPDETSGASTVGVGSGGNTGRGGAASLVVGVLCAPALVRATGGVVVLGGGAGTVEADGANVTVVEGVVDTCSVGNGRLTWYSPSNIGAVLNVRGGGVVDFSGDVRPKTVQACKVYAGAEIKDPLGVVVWTTGIQAVQANLAKDVKLDVGKNRTYTF
jgi:hypothetical protein